MAMHTLSLTPPMRIVVSTARMQSASVCNIVWGTTVGDGRIPLHRVARDVIKNELVFGGCSEVCQMLRGDGHGASQALHVASFGDGVPFLRIGADLNPDNLGYGHSMAFCPFLHRLVLTWNKIYLSRRHLTHTCIHIYTYTQTHTVATAINLSSRAPCLWISPVLPVSATALPKHCHADKQVKNAMHVSVALTNSKLNGVASVCSRCMNGIMALHTRMG
eukprot:m.417369 g.417369  ORF g.417369 m.417369 type:complete len:219 (-) comp21286_c0_seq17:959-1615(-)